MEDLPLIFVFGLKLQRILQNVNLVAGFILLTSELQRSEIVLFCSIIKWMDVRIIYEVPLYFPIEKERELLVTRFP